MTLFLLEPSPELEVDQSGKLALMMTSESLIAFEKFSLGISRYLAQGSAEACATSARMGLTDTSGPPGQVYLPVLDTFYEDCTECHHPDAC